MHVLDDTMLCIFWKSLILWKWIFGKLHVSHVVMNLIMVNAHLTSWDGSMNMLPYIFDVRVCWPHIDMLSFLKMRKDKFPLQICDFKVISFLDLFMRWRIRIMSWLGEGNSSYEHEKYLCVWCIMSWWMKSLLDCVALNA